MALYVQFLMAVLQKPHRESQLEESGLRDQIIPKELVHKRLVVQPPITNVKITTWARDRKKDEIHLNKPFDHARLRVSHTWVTVLALQPLRDARAAPQ